MVERGILIASLICALALGASACSDPSQPVNPDPSTTIVRVQGVKVTPQSIQFVAIGETKQLAATVSPADATDQSLVWESTDSAVATVDGVGRVIARGVGSGVFVTAYTNDGGFQASVNVTVSP